MRSPDLTMESFGPSTFLFLACLLGELSLQALHAQQRGGMTPKRVMKNEIGKQFETETETVLETSGCSKFVWLKHDRVLSIYSSSPNRGPTAAVVSTLRSVEASYDINFYHRNM